MNEKLTDITLVVDRSGSMSAIRDDAQGGINEFIRQQKAEPNDANLTLVQFDNHYEFVHNGTPIQDVGEFELVPRGSTALLDAVGRAINETGSRLGHMPEPDRPGLVIFMIVTDGEENSSREFTCQKIKEMIEHQQATYSWQFLFLAANQDAFAEAGSMGINATHAANYSAGNTRGMHGVMAQKVSKMRRASANNETIMSAFTDEEREGME